MSIVLLLAIIVLLGFLGMVVYAIACGVLKLVKCAVASPRQNFDGAGNSVGGRDVSGETQREG